MSDSSITAGVINEFKKKYKELFKELHIDDKDSFHDKIISSLKNSQLNDYKDELTDEQISNIKEAYQKDEKCFDLFKKYGLPANIYEEFISAIMKDGVLSACEAYKKKVIKKHFNALKKDLEGFFSVQTELNPASPVEIDTEMSTEKIIKSLLLKLGVNDDLHEIIIDNLKKGCSDKFENELTEEQFELINICFNENERKKNFENKSILIKQFINNIFSNQNVTFQATYEIFMNVNNLSFEELRLKIDDGNKATNTFDIISSITKYFISCLKVGNDFSEIFNSPKFRDKNSPLFCFDENTLIIQVYEIYEPFAQDLVLLLSKMSKPIPFSYLWYDNPKGNFINKIHLKAFSDIFYLNCPFIVSIGESNIGKSRLLNDVFTTSFVTDKNGIFSGGVDITLNTEEFATGFNIVDVHTEFNIDLLTTLFSIFTSEKCWILLHIKEEKKIKEYLHALFKIGIKKENIILILRDIEDDSDINFYETENQLQNQIIKICHTHNGNYKYSLNDLKTFLFKITGAGKNKKFPPAYKETVNKNYNVAEENIKRSNNIEIVCHSKEFRDISLKITSILKEKELKDFRNELYPHLKCISEVEELKKLKTTENSQKNCSTNYDREIEKVFNRKKQLIIPEIIKIYEKQFRLKKFSILKEINRALQVHQEPIIRQKMDHKKSIIKQYQDINKEFEESLEKKKSNHDSLETQKKDYEQKIKDISKEIDNQSVGSELFLREIFSMYTDTEFLKQNSSLLNYNEFIDAVAESMVHGNDIEIIDGDYNTFNQDIFKDLFSRLDEKIKNLFQSYNDQILVVSVIGPQSTGKSTLLNKLFNTNFQMSAGRCTKGLYASFKKTTLNGKDHFLLILDTEGLLSIEKSNEEYDKQLTLFSMACSHIFIINVNGEINNAIRKILSISLYAAGRTQTLQHKPIIYFVLRNMIDLNIEKQSEMIAGIENALKEVSKLSNIPFKSVIDYRDQDSYVLTVSAFTKDSIGHEKKTIFETTKSSFNFCDIMEKFRAKLLQNTVDSKSPISKLSTWSNHAATVWKTILCFNDFFMYESIKEIEERDELTKVLNELIDKQLKPKMQEIKTKYLSSLENEAKNEKTNTIIVPHLQLDQEIDDFIKEIHKTFEDNEKTKSKSKALVKEYFRRIDSFINTIKDEIQNEIKKIKEKFSIKVILKNSRNEMETCAKLMINDWQTKKLSNDGNIDTIKINFKSQLNIKVSKIKKEFLQNLEKLKKNDDQISTEVFELFVQLKNLLQTNKNFYVIKSIEKFKTKIDENNSFLRLNEKYGHKIDEISIGEIDIDKFFQLFDNGALEKIKTKKENIFQRIYHKATKGIKNKLSNNEINEDENFEDGVIFIEIRLLSAFIELYKILYCKENNLVAEICNLKESIDINILKGKILRLYENIDNINLSMRSSRIEFNRLKVEEVIIEVLFKEIKGVIKRYNETKLSCIKNEFEEAVQNLYNKIEANLNQTLDDIRNGQSLISEMVKNIRQASFDSCLKEFTQSLDDACLLPYEFQKKCDEVFLERNEYHIFQYITEPAAYMSALFEKHFKLKLKEKEEKFKKQLKEDFKESLKKLKAAIGYLKCEIFASIPVSTNHITEDEKLINKLYYEILKLYLSNDTNATSKLKDIYNNINSANQTPVVEKSLDMNKAKFKYSSCLYNHVVNIEVIKDAAVYTQEMINYIEETEKKEVNPTEEEQKKLSFDDTSVQNKKQKLYDKSLGCPARCPYCGVKCDETTPQHDIHKASHHWLMAFRGSWEYIEDGNKGFVFDICNSIDNIGNSKWKEVVIQKDRRITNSDPAFKERIKNYNLHYGTLTMTLIWENRNDLDLHVECPCGTHIFHGNRECSTCDGYLEKDMNICNCNPPCDPDGQLKKFSGCSLKPIEHIYFKKKAPNGIYKIYVKNFKVYDNSQLKTSFKFQITSESEGSITVPIYEAKREIENFNGSVFNLDDFSDAPPIGFLEHVQRYFNDWKNIREDQDAGKRIIYENNLKRSWNLIRTKMATKYGFEDNTPVNFKNL